MDLSKDEVFKLIEEYKNQRILWDSEHKGHFNKLLKMNSWQTIAQVLGIDEMDAKRKMASLLGSFRREKSKTNKMRKSGSTYKSDWFAFKNFSFLLETEERRIRNRESSYSEEENVSNEEPVECEEMLIPKIEQDFAASFDDTQETIADDFVYTQEQKSDVVFVKPTPPYQRKRVRSYINESIPEDFIEKDDYETRECQRSKEAARKEATAKFVSYLEIKLNEFSPATSTILIHKINQLIFEADMSSISESQPPYATGNASMSRSASPSEVNSFVEIKGNETLEKEYK